MKREAVLHIPMSQYAHGIREDTIVLRIRVARDDIESCLLYVGDTACRKNPIDFFSIEMKKIAHDLFFDYYEAEFRSPYKRIYYYFNLDDGIENINYFSDFFRTDLPEDRSEYYKLPFNHRADIADIPDWVKDAVVYNIFPDSFATAKDYISGVGTSHSYKSGEMEYSERTFGRLGGTLRGIAENADYLENLGINCIYINPLFAACEYHKYDTIDYFSVDPNFGSNEDFEMMVEVMHSRGIRVIIDGVFNHCGWKFYAFKDVVKNGRKSRYADWFYGLTFPVICPDDPEDYPNYECFAYERLMPKWNTQNPQVKELLLSVGEYWIKEYNIDGWRLDVASEVNDDFWREFRKRVKAVKPDAFIIGEVWESAGHWMQGDMYDSVMNYDMRKLCKYYFAQRLIDTETFNAGVTSMLLRYRKNLVYGDLNLLDSHDVSRFLSVCSERLDRFRLAVVFQMMFIGIPSVFYGDEQGLTGNIESEYRCPMVFKGDGEIYGLYHSLITIRRQHEAVRRGDFEVVTTNEIYAFKRTTRNETLLIVLNNSDKTIDTGGIIKGEVIMSSDYADNKLKSMGFSITRED